MMMKKVILLADRFNHDFVPLSLEKPMGLWEVRGEKPVERLICQAKEAGITDITLITGYKGEMLSYLGDTFGVSLIKNAYYGEENGVDFLRNHGLLDENAVICSSGDYYFDNPFTAADGTAEKAKIDTFEDLRVFDPKYLSHSGCQVIRNIKLVFRCEEEDVKNFRYINRRQTNSSCVFEVKGVNYIYRYPAEGIGEVVSWKNEKASMVIAKKLGIDPTYIYADADEGWKIMEFVGPHGKPDYTSFEDTRKVIKVLKKLHSSDVVTDFGLKPWEDTEATIENLNRINPDIFAPYLEMREQVKKLYDQTINDGVKKCFCHGDTYSPNWMLLQDGSAILIDWEYAGYTDPGVDIGYYIADADYGMEEAERFIREYLADEFTEEKLRHFLIYSVVIAYYCFVWALQRRALGEPRPDVEDAYKEFILRYIALLS